MKLAKLSLATAIALGSSAAYADVDLSKLKISGQATLYYQTKDDEAVDDQDLFKKDKNSKANVGLSLKFESDLGNNFGFGARLNALDTLGLEHNLVSGTMQIVNNDKLVIPTDDNKTDAKDGREDGLTTMNSRDKWYWAEAYLTKKVGSTTIKVGRQELNTPLMFSEKWNVMPTTFDAAVIINQSVSNLTLVGAYVGKSNTHGSLGNFNTPVGTLAKDGAYAAGAIYKNDIANGNFWFYNVPTVANALWIDGKAKVAGAKLLAQFAMIMPDEDGLRNHLASPTIETDDTTAFALQGTYKIQNTTVSLAGSFTNGDKDKVMLNVANFGTFKGVGGVKTKLATATISGDGDEAGATDTTAYKLKVVQDMKSYGKIIAQFAQYIHGEDSNKAYNRDETGTVFEFLYKQKLSGMNLLFAYIYDENINFWTSELDESAQTLRVVARYKF